MTPGLEGGPIADIGRLLDTTGLDLREKQWRGQTERDGHAHSLLRV